MKRFLILLLLATAVFALPQPQGVVNDYADIITPDWETKLTELISNIESNTTAEIAVVTVQSLSGKPVEEVSLQYLTEWGVGKGNDNGVVILIAPNERKYRIETGYGVEGILPDGRVGRLGRDILVPAFKGKNYGEGLFLLVEEIGGLLKQDPEIVAKYTKRREAVMPYVGLIMMIFFFLSPVLSIAAAHQKNVKKKAFTFWGWQAFSIILFVWLGLWVPNAVFIFGGIFFFIVGAIAYSQEAARARYGRGFYWGPGSFGGLGGRGFGGFGGGSGGGGGASGGW